MDPHEAIDYTVERIVPTPFVIKWTGRDFKSDDDMFYEPSPESLNRAVCARCKWVFSLNHHNEDHNTFSSLLHLGQENTTLLWAPNCTRCVAQKCGNHNVLWPELDGWLVNWEERYLKWDVVWIVTSGLPLPLRETVALRVLQYLAFRGECFPCQNARSQEQDICVRERRDLEYKAYLKERETQRTITSFFQPSEPRKKKPCLSPKQEPIDPMLLKTRMNDLLRRSCENDLWRDLCLMDSMHRLTWPMLLAITTDTRDGKVTMLSTSLMHQDNGGGDASYKAMKPFEPHYLCGIVPKMGEGFISIYASFVCKQAKDDDQDVFQHPVETFLTRCEQDATCSVSYLSRTEKRRNWKRDGRVVVLLYHYEYCQKTFLHLLWSWWKTQESLYLAQ